jgi:hypothetical protein
VEPLGAVDDEHDGKCDIALVSCVREPLFYFYVAVVVGGSTEQFPNLGGGCQATCPTIGLSMD